ncbi:MAG: S-layer homology domain-containing protein [Eubacteriales bacterium]|nr:S-layer homology domain-containing protein [Eubacteriales bacterium]
MKKILKGLVVSAALLSMTATAFGATFTDVEGTSYDWASPYVEDMAEKGLISGYNEDGVLKFKPENTVSKIEAISLFARAMGSNSELNKPAIEYAMAQYGDVIDTYELKFGQKDVAFMLYRGVLTEEEAAAYLTGDVKNQPMLRYEATTIITKAMGGESEAKKNMLLDLEYTDVADIPSAAKKYVYYVSEKGIMSGTGDGSFSPNTGVLRSEIAVMLSKTVDVMNASCNEVKIGAIDSEAMTFTVIDSGNESATYKYTDNTVFYIEGVKVPASNIEPGVRAIVTDYDGNVQCVDINSAEPDRVVKAVYSNYQNVEGSLYISVTNPATNKAETYACISNINNISKSGKSATIRDFTTGDYVILSLSGGKVEKIVGTDKSQTIKGATIEAINHNTEIPTIVISHSDPAYDGMELLVGSNVYVLKDGADSDMNSVYRGDKITVTLDYGVISRITAISLKRTVDGTIRSITIAQNPTMTVLANNKETVYDVANDVAITVNGEAATLYDFRVGDKVSIALESEAVIKISTVSSQATEGNLTGTVVSANAAYKFIKILISDANGNTYEETVYCTDSKTTFITASGNSKQFRDIKEGNIVNVYGTYNNGAFSATTVIIVK